MGMCGSEFQCGVTQSVTVLLVITGGPGTGPSRLQIKDFQPSHLNSEIEEEVYMELPDEYKEVNKVGKLNKAIYRTRQGGN